MTVLSDETKATKMREALSKLAAEYMRDNRLREAQGVLNAQKELNESEFSRIDSRMGSRGDQFNETLVRLYDIILAA